MRRARGHDGGIQWLREKAVDEIDVAAVLEAAIERAVRPEDLDLVPADLRNLQAGLRREAHDLAAKNVQPRRATVELLALLKQRLVANANTKEQPAGADEVLHPAEQILALHRTDAIVERTHAGQHHRTRLPHVLGPGDDVDIRAHFAQSLLHAAQVAGTVIKQSNHGGSVGRGERVFNRRLAVAPLSCCHSRRAC